MKKTKKTTPKKKKKRKMSPAEKRKQAMRWIAFMVFQVSIIMIFVMNWKDNKQITEDDCVTIVGKVDTADYIWSPVNAVDISIESHDLWVSGLYSVYSLEQMETDLLKEEQVVVKVRKARSFPYFNKKPETLVVDMRSEDTVYTDMAKYNRRKLENRVALLLSFPFLWLVGTGLLLLKIILKF